MRKLRISLAAIFFVGITLLLVGIGHQWWGWMAKLQFLPSCFALNIAVIVAILLVTLLLGRLYCSVICPLGILQDLVLKLNKKKKFSFSKEHKWLRYIILSVAVASIFVLGQVGIGLIAPYSAYGRIVAAICSVVIGSTSAALLLVGGFSLLLVGLSAYFFGRIWCNTICPVGSVLGLLSRFALWQPVIDTEKCINCGRCARKCKSSCIDPKAHAIDMSRCVVCFDCLDNCSVGAIHYKFVGIGKKALTAHNEASAAPKSCEGAASDSGRRSFIATGALLLGSGVLAKAQSGNEVVKNLDGGLAEIIDKKEPGRAERLVPPGAKSVKDFYDHCTACQLCIQNCPNKVLLPSTDLEHLLQPQMQFMRGYCRPECNICSTICPAGAISEIQLSEKIRTKIGTARVNLELCLAANEEAGCGNCAHHCPTGAVRMVKVDGRKLRIPTVVEEQCIGCGACEHLCPSRPISAITVDGLSKHRVL